MAIRILHAINLLEATGNGIANVCVDLACQQAGSGHEVAVATLPGGFADVIQQHGVTLLPLDFRIGRSPARALQAVRRARRVVRSFRPDVVHSHTLAATAIMRLAASGTGSRVVATVHNEYQRGVLVMAVAHRLVGVSHPVSAALRRRGVPTRRIRTVLNGTIGSPRRPPAPALLDLPFPRLVAIGAVSHRKGADLVLDAFGELSPTHPGLELWFVGNVDAPELAEHARSAPWGDRVHFTGFDAQPQRYLGPGAIHVLASRRDPAPLALIEAMEVGAPIVATAVDGVPEMLADGAHGLLVPAGDAHALVTAIEGLLEDRALREEYARRSAAGARRFSLDRVGREYVHVYEELIPRGRKADHMTGDDLGAAPRDEAA